MTDHNLADHVPPGATIITPTDGESVEIGFGYVAETGEDVMMLTIVDKRRGPHVVVFTPELAREVAAAMTEKTMKFEAMRDAQLRRLIEQSGDDLDDRPNP
jgi:hypothetical protein